ncbi:MAG: GntR family transcriptional regulator [Haloechinothrix sp.]
MPAETLLPFRRDGLVDRVYDVLRSRIIFCELEPGAKLNMDALSREMRVSQTPIREAINRLASERLVLIEPYRGVRVAPLLSEAQLNDLMRARLVIEVGAARSADIAVPEAAATELVSRMDELARADALDVRAFNEADAAFHRTLVAAAGNEFLLQAFDDLKAHVQIARHFLRRSSGEAREANLEHRRILAAVRKEDRVRLQQELTAHVEGVLTRLARPTQGDGS